jgi:hypothetical protein
MSTVPDDISSSRKPGKLNTFRQQAMPFNSISKGQSTKAATFGARQKIPHLHTLIPLNGVGKTVTESGNPFGPSALKHPEHAESFSSVPARSHAEPNAAHAAKPDYGVLPSATVCVHLLATTKTR